MAWKSKTGKILHYDPKKKAAYDHTPSRMEYQRQIHRARYRLEKKGKVSKGDGKDVGHLISRKNGGDISDGVVVQDRKSNRAQGGKLRWRKKK